MQGAPINCSFIQKRIRFIAGFALAGMLGMVLGWRPALAQKTQGSNEFKALCLDTARLRWAWTQFDTLEYDSLVLVPLMMGTVSGPESSRLHTGGEGYPWVHLAWSPKTARDRWWGPWPGSMDADQELKIPTHPKPWTRLAFGAGGNNLQTLGLEHHQRLGPGLRAGARFRSLTHDGFLQRSGGKSRATDLYAGGTLAPGRHFVWLEGRIMALDWNENGGVSSTTAPLSAGYNPLNLGVRLGDASSQNGMQRWSLRNDFKYNNGWQVFHRMGFETLRWGFRDGRVGQNLGFYTNPGALRDSSSASDSTALRQWSQELGLSRNTTWGTLQVALTWSHWRYYSGTTQPNEPSNGPAAVDRRDQGLTMQASWAFPGGSTLRMEQGLYHGFLGLASRLEWEIIPQQKRTWLPTRTLWSAWVEPPSYRQRLLQTNALSWDVAERPSTRGMNLLTTWEPRMAGSHRWTLNGGVAWNLNGLGNDSSSSDGKALLMQSQPGPVAYARLELRGRWYNRRSEQGWHWKYQHLLQWSSDPTWIAVPLWSMEDCFYYQRKTSKGWSWVGGLALRWMSAFNGPDYRPELGLWTLGTAGARGQVGAYPWVDLLAGIKVRQTLLFVRWEHANLGWPNSVGQWVPGYPVGDRRLRLGVDWTFWD